MALAIPSPGFASAHTSSATTRRIPAPERAFLNQSRNRAVEVPWKMRRSDRRIFEPLRGEFELPIERLLWEQPVERACYSLRRAAQYCFPALLGGKRRPCH